MSLKKSRLANGKAYIEEVVAPTDPVTGFFIPSDAELHRRLMLGDACRQCQGYGFTFQDAKKFCCDNCGGSGLTIKARAFARVRDVPGLTSKQVAKHLDLAPPKVSKALRRLVKERKLASRVITPNVYRYYPIGFAPPPKEVRQESRRESRKKTKRESRIAHVGKRRWNRNNFMVLGGVPTLKTTQALLRDVPISDIIASVVEKAKEDL